MPDIVHGALGALLLAIGVYLHFAWRDRFAREYEIARAKIRHRIGDRP